MENAQRRTSASPARTQRSVPSDWYVDPADPQPTSDSLEAQATAYLAAHEVLQTDTEVTVLHPEPKKPSSNVWLGIPGFGDTADDGELAWQADALCAQTDPEAFFPEKGGSTRDAKKVCGACTVKQECLEYALANDERFGIWGGMSERERRRLRKKSS